MIKKHPGFSGPTSPTLLYWLLRAFVRTVVGVVLFGKVKIDGRENVPRGGGLLVISNHIATGDPPLLAAVFPRPLHFMAKVEWFTGNPLVALLVRHSMSFPVVRESPDRAALKYTLKLLDEGRAVCIYPEGTRAEDHRMQRAKAGSGFIARHSAVPIVPVGVWGTENVLPKGSHFPKRAEVHIAYGEPFHLPENIMDNQAAADYMLGKVAELLPPGYRGQYGEGGVREDAEVLKAV
jgi:1-acyl-sn-glycerol-3-phosphate acyltransferase